MYMCCGPVWWTPGVAIAGVPGHAMAWPTPPKRAGAADAQPQHATMCLPCATSAIRSAVDATPTCRAMVLTSAPHTLQTPTHLPNADAPPPSGVAQPAAGYRPMGGGDNWRQQGATGDVPGASAPAQPASNFNDWAAPGR